MYERIVVFNSVGIGDAILSTPVLYALRNKFPKSRITLVAPPITRGIIEGLPFIDEVLYYTRIMPVLPVVRHLWRYDLAIRLDHKSSSGIIPFLARIPVRVGALALGTKRGRFLTHKFLGNPDNPDVYQPYNYAAIINETLGISFDEDLTKLHISDASDESKKKVDSLFETLDLQADEKVVAISPFSTQPSKDWPYYEKFVDELKKRIKCKVVMLGEARNLNKGEYSNTVNWLGKTTLNELGEVIRRCDLIVTNCSAALHIAAAVDVPIVVVYGESSAETYAPRHNAIVIQNETLPCRPCRGKSAPCNNTYPCLTSNTVEEVLTACVRIFEEKKLIRQYSYD